MAYLRGEEGRVCFDPGSTPDRVNNRVIGTTSWSLNISKDVLDVTRMGEKRRRWLGSVYGAEGSVTMLYDTGSSTARDELVDEILVQEVTPNSQFSLYPKENDGLHCLNFVGIVTGFDVGATVGEMEEVTMSFIVSGPITTTLVAA